MRNKVGDWNTSAASGARSSARTASCLRWAIAIPNGAFFMNGGQPWGNGVPGFGSLIIGNNGIETKTTQLLLSAEKPYTTESHWGTIFAYTLPMRRKSFDHDAALCIRRGDHPAISLHQFERGAATSFREHRLVRGTMGLCRRRQAHARDAHSGQRYCLLSWAATYRDGASLHTHRGDAQEFLRLSFAGSSSSPRTSTSPTTGRIYARLDVLNIFNWHDYSDYAQQLGHQRRATIRTPCR